MGCGCGGRKNNNAHPNSEVHVYSIPATAITVTVTPEVLADRQKKCERCAYNTKNSNRNLIRMNSATPLEKCSRNGQLLVVALPNKQYSCPAGLFSKVS